MESTVRNTLSDIYYNVQPTNSILEVFLVVNPSVHLLFGNNPFSPDLKPALFKQSKGGQNDTHCHRCFTFESWRFILSVLDKTFM